MKIMQMVQKANVNKVSWKKVLVNAALAALAAGITYGSEFVTQLDFGQYGPIVVATLVPLLVYIKQWILEYLAANKPDEVDVIGKDCPNKNCNKK